MFISGSLSMYLTASALLGLMLLMFSLLSDIRWILSFLCSVCPLSAYLSQSGENVFVMWAVIMHGLSHIINRSK